MQRFIVFIIIYYLCCMTSLFAQSSEQNNPQIKLLQAVLKGNPMGELTELELPNGIKAQTIVFCDLRWEVKNVPARGLPGGRQRSIEFAMALPEKERLERLRKIENNVQVWMIPLAQHPNVSAELKEILPPNQQPHNSYRELAFAGKGMEYAWYLHAPIGVWAKLQREFKLEGGDDPLEAAFRGMMMIDSGNRTIGPVRPILNNAGAAIIPYLEKAIEDKHPKRKGIIHGLTSSKEEVVRWLFKQYHSSDQAVTRGVRNNLIGNLRKDVEPSLYKPICLDVLTSQALDNPNFISYVSNAIQLAEDNDWPEAKPLIQQIYQHPGSVFVYQRAFFYLHGLKEEELADDFIDAWMTIASSAYKENKITEEALEQAKQRLINEQDKELVLVYTLIAACLTEGRGASNRGQLAALDVLKTLDRAMVKSRLLSFKRDNLVEVEALDWLARQLGFK